MRHNITNSIHNKKCGVKLLGTMLALLLASGVAVAQSIGGSVYGGGKGTSATVTGAVKVEVQAGTIDTDVYGGGALANTVGTTTVNLKGGKVTRNLYGGALGDDNVTATVSGAVQVTVSGGEVVNVFGCNNINGAPQSTVQVDINETTANTMNVTNVFGGGNLATYTGNPAVNIINGTVSGNVFGGGKGELVDGAQRGQKGKVIGAPQVTVGDNNSGHTAHVTGDVYGGGDAANVEGTPVVVVNDCNTTIGDLYGGGNAADVTGTNVTVNGGTINLAFGGGHGDKDASNPSKYADVNGNVSFNVVGGTIAKVFAGSNSRGSITGTSLLLNIDKSTAANACAMKIGEVYGGGNEAEGKAATISIGCTGTLVGGNDGHIAHPENIGTTLEGIGKVFGGANQANVTGGNITLNINSGIVRQVFGGNNTSGEISGTIQVNINKTGDACGWYVGDVFGGGDHAWYGGKPDVNIQNGTVYGNVYGGGNDITEAGKGVNESDVEVSGGIVRGGVYGGCNENGTVVTKSKVVISGSATVGQSGTPANVYGGGLGENTKVKGDVDVTVNGASVNIYGDVYGGSAKGLVNCNDEGTAQNGNSKTDVTLTNGTITGNIYGGGHGLDSKDAHVWGPITVTVNDGSVTTYTVGTNVLGGNVYGCNNLKGAPQISTWVDVKGGTIARDVYGGGNLADAPASTHVTIEGGIVSRDVYGGGAFANTGATTVDILGGTIGTSGVNTTGNVYGGGLGQASPLIEPSEGDVTINIGAATATNTTTGAMTNPSGTATILGSVYGANNAKGSPTGNVTVNVYQTGHTTATQTSGTDYAIDQVFGGGRNADYSASGKKATVNIWGCDNTIRRVFGGGDAAAAPEVETNLYGGRFDYVFGGGNGEMTAADINGNAGLGVHGGEIGHLFGGSNTSGTIAGQTNVLVDNTGACEEYIAEFFGGGNKVPINGNVNTTIGCGTNFGDVYGGSNKANITGDVKLNVKGGTFRNIFGGSKGVIADPAHSIAAVEANIDGNVTLNLFGGTVKKKNNEGGNVFGGSNYNGNITGKITVNVLDTTDCQAFTAVNLYGAGNLTAYTPTSSAIESPEVNIIHIKDTTSISGNVYGGGLGASATVTANPKVTIGYDAVTMGTPTTASSLIQGLVGSSYTMPTLYATIGGNVYGGGDEAAVVGNTSVTIQHANTQIGNDVYGGGNKANVKGSVTVNVNGGTITHDVYGGGALADVNVTNNALTPGKTTTVNLTGGTVTGSVYGGGLGQLTPSSIEAKVYGPVQVNAIGGTIGTVFGCNNLNGAPQSTVQVDVEKSTATGAPALNINNVYGGGNQAAYNAPSGTPNYPVVNIKNGNVVKQGNTDGNVFGGGLGMTAVVNGNPQVTIGDITSGHESYQAVVEGSAFGGGNAAKVNGVPVVLVQKCNTQVGLAYGGGNAADVYATNITVTGGNTVGEVYGGCYGAFVTGNTASNIDGNTNVLIKGGTINQVYGGNNASGNIVGEIYVTVNKDADACDMHIGEVYGGGNHAASRSNVDQILIYCTGSAANNEGIDYVYGGANEADIDGDITLKIFQGRINHVFGGNNNGGNVSGKITVNIEKNNETCDWYVGDVYGGGNLAAYTAPTATPNYPEVNVKNGTVTGKVFGGGKGNSNDATEATGMITGNPQVTIGDSNAAHCAIVTQNVYGGGNAAKVDGYTTVTYDDNNANSAVAKLFGGGESAGVTGATTVTVNNGKITGADDATHNGVYGGCNVKGNVGGLITLNINNGTFGSTGANNKIYIHGGGYGANTTTSGSVEVNIGNGSATPTIYGDVYGGSALGIVNSSTSTVNTSLHTNVNLIKGTINGSLYGGGLGSSQYEAKVYSPVHVKVTTGTVTGEVYGCNNVNGTPLSTVNVDVYNTDQPASGYAIGKVFGGGNQAAYGGTPEVKIHNCSNKIEYVYGGGNAASVAGTDVTVFGGIIDYVFGGCYGADVTPGGTNAKIYGGTIGKVFGANNSTGEVAGSISVTIEKTADTDPLGSTTACDLHINEVYGGGNIAGSHAGTITVGCTGTGNTEGIGDLYGGANNANITGDILVNITEGSIQNVFGGNNAGGSISGKTTVNINKKASPCVWSIGNVFGGGNLADFANQANVNILKGEVSGSVYGGGNQANVGSSIVTLTDGLITKGLYGGCNTSGSVTGDITLNVNGGQVGVDASNKADIYGGGFGEGTHTGGDVTLNFGTIDDNDTHTDKPEIFGDIYGGSAYGEVNATGKTTTVNIMNGVVNGNIYGGGHGRKADPANNISEASAKVYGKVFVNVGKQTATDTIGGAYLNNSVIYGCNNVNGSPQDHVEVNIWRNGLCDNDDYNSQNGSLYSIDQVFGGGNEADFNITGKFANVIVHDCSNSIRRVFGGSNASAAYGVNTTIHGGRYDYIYGGGNGEVTEANIGAGGVHLTITAGIVNQLYGGSNSHGSIAGSLVLNVSGANSSNACKEDINDIYCGGNYVDIIGNVTTTIDCSEGLNVDNLYGGCDHACVKKDANGNGGNVTLTVKGGTFKNVFGGSKGQRDGYTEGKRRHRNNYSADIEGDITLNIYGGTIENVYGGSNILGKVDGTITVNIIDHGGACALDIGNVYGGGNMTDYTPNYALSGGATERITPMVNVIHGTVKGNVYGGAKGSTLFGATITSSPRVVVGYDSSVTLPSSSTVTPANFRATVKGDIYGGGDAAAIDGNTEIQLKDRSKVRGDIYGGGNKGEVTGNTKVIVNGKN